MTTEVAPHTFDLTSEVDGLPLRGYRWSPNAEPQGTVAISHGAAEHSLRYARLARALLAIGVETWSIDQRGHGQSPGPNGLGDSGEAGWDGLVADLGQFVARVRDARPTVPLGLFGHSMGSFAAQQYLLDHSSALDFLALSGSRAFEVPALGAEPEAFTPNAAFEPARTPYDWLSRDEAEVDAYIADPLCGFETQTGRRESSALDRQRIADPEAFRDVRADLPILLLAGDQDPINRGMEGLRLLEGRLRGAGVARLDTQYYAGGRHEMLNETNRDEVTANLVGWIAELIAID